VVKEVSPVLSVNPTHHRIPEEPEEFGRENGKCALSDVFLGRELVQLDA
jgi:hypothetical protein